MEITNKEIIDYINNEIKECSEDLKTIHEEVKEGKKANPLKKLDDDAKIFENKQSSLAYIKSINDFSPFVIQEINKIDPKPTLSAKLFHHCFSILTGVIYIGIPVILNGFFLFSRSVRLESTGKRLTSKELSTLLSCMGIGIIVIIFISTLIYVCGIYFWLIKTKQNKRGIYGNISDYIINYHYDRKNFNGAEGQINRETYLKNIKFTGRYNFLAIRLSEIGEDPTSKKGEKIIKLYKGYCFFIDIYFGNGIENKLIKKITRDPIKTPIRYAQRNFITSAIITLIIMILVNIGTYSLISFFGSECRIILYLYSVLSIVVITCPSIQILRLSSNFRKILTSIKPLFPTDVYDDFVNLAKNAIKEHDSLSYYFSYRIKKIKKDEKGR